MFFFLACELHGNLSSSPGVCSSARIKFAVACREWICIAAVGAATKVYRFQHDNIDMCKHNTEHQRSLDICAKTYSCSKSDMQSETEPSVHTLCNLSNETGPKKKKMLENKLFFANIHT